MQGFRSKLLHFLEVVPEAGLGATLVGEGGASRSGVCAPEEATEVPSAARVGVGACGRCMSAMRSACKRPCVASSTKVKREEADLEASAEHQHHEHRKNFTEASVGLHSSQRSSKDAKEEMERSLGHREGRVEEKVRFR